MKIIHQIIEKIIEIKFLAHFSCVFTLAKVEIFIESTRNTCYSLKKIFQLR